MLTGRYGKQNLYKIAGQVFAKRSLTKAVLNLIKNEQAYKGSIARKQLKAALTEEYLENVLQC
ncbi:MAG: hypothetical protein Kow0029_02930 [Candidatus Rifleibacteriota bacterium]